MAEKKQEEKYFNTDIEKIPKIVDTCRNNFYSATPTTISYRIEQIKGIIKFLEDCEDEIVCALKYYFGGNKSLHYSKRLWIVKYECYDAIKKIHSWVKSSKKSQPFPFNFLWSTEIVNEPLGITAIIGAWNFPVNLLLRPLIGAIAGGNAVILKPSEITNKIAMIFNNKLSKYVDPKLVQVVCGGVKETTALLKCKFDFVLYTGNGMVGKIVMNACSKFLTPCCLELGGKNPVIIDDDVDLKIAAKRILYGRFNFNGGQVCVAPEYIFISSSKQDEFIKIARELLLVWYGADGNSEESDSYFSIVNNRHFNRVQKLRNYYINSEPDKIAVGAKNDKQFGLEKVNALKRHLPPMILKDIEFNNDHIMKEEVFGPILSIIPMKGSFNQWKGKVNQLILQKETPLVCYIFSRNKSVINELSLKINAGTICVNETITFMGLRIPFGGSGESGMGRYGGKYSFDQFTHQKPIAIAGTGLKFINKDRYPNYDKDILDLEKKLKKEANGRKTLDWLIPTPASTITKVTKYSLLVATIVFAIYVISKKLYR